MSADHLLYTEMILASKYREFEFTWTMKRGTDGKYFSHIFIVQVYNLRFVTSFPLKIVQLFYHEQF